MKLSMNTKLKWLREKMKMLDLQGMIISNPTNIRYLTGIVAEGILLITRKENIYLTDARYIESAPVVTTKTAETFKMNIVFFSTC